MADLIVLLTQPLLTGINTPVKQSIIVPLSSISDKTIFDPLDQDLMFFNSGRIKRFVLNGVPLMSIFDSDTGKFKGYFSETKFWENNNINDLKTNLTTASIGKLGEAFNFYTYGNLDKIKPDDNVILATASIGSRLKENNTQEHNFDIYYSYKRIPYAVLNPILDEVTDLDYSKILSYESTEIKIPISDTVSNYGNYVLRKGLLRSNGTVDEFNEDENNVFLDIMRVFEIIETEQSFKDILINENLYAPFEAHLALFNRYSKDYGQIDEAYHRLYTDEYFSIFRLKLIQFRYWILQYKETNYTTIHPTDLKVQILDLFPSDELAFLPYQFKIDLLESLFIEKGGNISYISNLTVPQQETVIKLVQAIYIERNGQINYTEINDFFSFLRKDILINEGLLAEKRQTYYEILYNEIDDPRLFGDDGKGRKGQFVHAVYNLWTLSKYNPGHVDSIIANNALSNFSYTKYPYYEKDQYPEGIQITAAPAVLTYRSDKILLWYVDNFKFRFVNKQIVVVEQRNETLGNTELGINLTDYTIGFYDPFQPVAIAATNADDTIIMLPVKTLTPSNGQDVNVTENSMPIFYLHYVDDLGDYSDFKQSVRTVIDILTLYYGAVSAFKYARAFSLLRNTASGLFEIVDIHLLYKIIGGLVTSTAETLASAANIIYQLVTSDCEVYLNSSQPPPSTNDSNSDDYNFCKSANAWLFALEMVSMSVNALTRSALKTATRKMMNAMSSETNVLFTEAQRSCLWELADINLDVNRFVNNIPSEFENVKQYLNGIKNNYANRVYDFSTYFRNDVKNSRKVLAEYNDDITLLEEWIMTPEYDRFYFNLLKFDQAPLFLKNIRYIKQSDELDLEIFKGVIAPDTTTTPFSWDAKGVHHYDALMINGKGGLGRIVENTKYPVGPEGLGYYKAKVQLYHLDFPNNGHWKVKNSSKGMSTFFPDSWDKKKLQNELAYAYTYRKYVEHNQYTGIMTDGVKVRFHIDNGIIKTAFPNL
ncbi:EndoU domain-containing protein [Sphingobacterium sp. SRCM116780]|uniref:EndoU domain-containing protein n=1 Tax=Sphingobacterium sp. SRCM116780 TaxID=2907623 RepID=UPI001F46DD52|nr:EndoU domain-containing protein [Sphingobacterium sp. SRCM116780]UIR56356.1 EndoU domain-containing protein [Sphingobacterium sp. SRCM116780]